MKTLDKQASLEDIIITSLQSLKEIRQTLDQQDEEIKRLAAKIETGPVNYFMIAGYCSLCGLRVDVSEVYGIEQRVVWLIGNLEIPVGKFPDPDLGDLRTYRLDVLDEVFDSRM
ncbi:hypothetical protein DEAC_c43030 [Desulfosporosinus acididurans]|uniref:Uncharacterized protein n=1 Tax=Desulfosporosinus acididurans TaxID=476652 RepID=A0A0J1FJX6_9FIRM|nr:hypothetical protein [Desulfosporosinus acididurans]KLU63774.1 hypothetical protein DEAC_c43030 [Desulfosporosinus acididurans]